MVLACVRFCVPNDRYRHQLFVDTVIRIRSAAAAAASDIDAADGSCDSSVIDISTSLHVGDVDATDLRGLCGRSGTQRMFGPLLRTDARRLRVRRVRISVQLWKALRISVTFDDLCITVLIREKLSTSPYSCLVVLLRRLCRCIVVVFCNF